MSPVSVENREDYSASNCPVSENVSLGIHVAENSYRHFLIMNGIRYSLYWTNDGRNRATRSCRYFENTNHIMTRIRGISSNVIRGYTFAKIGILWTIYIAIFMRSLFSWVRGAAATGSSLSIFYYVNKYRPFIKKIRVSRLSVSTVSILLLRCFLQLTSRWDPTSQWAYRSGQLASWSRRDEQRTCKPFPKRHYQSRIQWTHWESQRRR